jgi:hypothetical protein
MGYPIQEYKPACKNAQKTKIKPNSLMSSSTTCVAIVRSE